MKQKSTELFVLVLIFLLLSPASGFASWVKLSPHQLEQSSEIILVGFIEGAAGEYHYADGIWDTKWKVHVMYYLKGDRQDKYLTVYTPGNKNGRVSRSTDFRLNESGNLVLLFLEKKDKRYFPITPQGIIGLQSNRYSKEVLDPPTGVTVLKEYSIKDGKLSPEEKEQLEQIIKGKAIINPTDSGFESGKVFWQTVNLLVLAAVLVLIGWIIARMTKKK